MPAIERALREHAPLPSGSGQSFSISADLFARFQTLIYSEAGIWLAPHKTGLLVGRLSRRLRVLGIPSMLDYYLLVTHPSHQQEKTTMLDCITTNETHFFREPRHFEFMAQQLFPRWHREAANEERPRRLRVWSAGCSSGEEAYSMAMMLLKHFPPEMGWDTEILATDISTRVLEKAQAGIYPLDKSHEIPKDFLHAYMLKGIADQEGSMKVAPEVQRLVRFARVNLHADHYPFSGLFNLILCRNVLIYFDQEAKHKVVTHLLRHLAPGGLLVVGHSENLNGFTPKLRTILPTIYSPANSAEKYSAIAGNHQERN